MSGFLSSGAFGAIAVLGAAGAIMLLSRAWRWRVVGLALQYVGVFWLAPYVAMRQVSVKKKKG